MRCLSSLSLIALVGKENMLFLRLSIKWQILCDGKEECSRETQEGCPAPFEILSFQNFYKVLKT